MGIDAVAWAKKMEEYGAGEILLTSMNQDGQKTGYDLELDARSCRGSHNPGHCLRRRRKS